MDDKRNFQWGGGPSTLFEGSQPISQYKINGPHKGSIYFRAGTGLFVRNNPCLRKVAVKPFGLALASLVSSAKFVSSHFVHEPNFVEPSSRVLDPLVSLVNKKNQACAWFFLFRAGKGSRTLDIDLGKVALYQLSYSRVGSLNLVKLGGL